MLNRDNVLQLISRGNDHYAVVVFEESRGSVVSRSLGKVCFLDRSNTIQPKLWDRRTSSRGANPDTETYLVELVGENAKRTVRFVRIVASLAEVRECLRPSEKYEEAQRLLVEYIKRELPDSRRNPQPAVRFNGRDAYTEIDVCGHQFTVDVDLDRLYWDEVHTYVRNERARMDAEAETSN